MTVMRKLALLLILGLGSVGTQAQFKITKDTDEKLKAI